MVENAVPSQDAIMILLHSTTILHGASDPRRSHGHSRHPGLGWTSLVILAMNIQIVSIYSNAICSTYVWSSQFSWIVLRWHQAWWLSFIPLCQWSQGITSPLSSSQCYMLSV
jgi:hypothetical protein